MLCLRFTSTLKKILKKFEFKLQEAFVDLHDLGLHTYYNFGPQCRLNISPLAAKILILGDIKIQKYVVPACSYYLYQFDMMLFFTRQCLKYPAVSKYLAVQTYLVVILHGWSNIPGCVNIPSSNITRLCKYTRQCKYTQVYLHYRVYFNTGYIYTTGYISLPGIFYYWYT